MGSAERRQRENEETRRRIIDAARDLGLDVPGDVSIAGFDNVPQGAWHSYQLTTIAQPIEKLLDATLEVLDQRLKGEEGFESKIDLFQGKLLVRGSVKLIKS